MEMTYCKRGVTVNGIDLQRWLQTLHIVWATSKWVLLENGLDWKEGRREVRLYVIVVRFCGLLECGLVVVLAYKALLNLKFIAESIYRKLVCWTKVISRELLQTNKLQPILLWSKLGCVDTVYWLPISQPSWRHWTSGGGSLRCCMCPPSVTSPHSVLQLSRRGPGCQLYSTQHLFLIF